MAFLRIKPVRKVCKDTGKASTYHYVYEVESYKSRGKVKQKTLRLLGRYIQLEKQKQKNFPIKRALECDSKEQLFKEIFALNLANYGFEPDTPDIFRRDNIIANLKTCKVFDMNSNRDIYLNLNGKFFGTYTLKKALKSDAANLVDFVKAITDSGAIGIEFSEFKNHKEGHEPSHNLKLLQIILDRFGSNLDKMKEMDFETFKEEIGY
jgi:hypothetical protein